MRCRAQDAGAKTTRDDIVECIQQFSYVIDTRHDDCAEAMKEFATDDFTFHLAREGNGKGGPGEYTIELDLAKFSGFIQSLQAKYVATQHTCCNYKITITSPETAEATTYCQNWHDKKEGGYFVFHGMYIDKLVKTPSGWRCKSRHQYPLFQ